MNRSIWSVDTHSHTHVYANDKRSRIGGNDRVIITLNDCVAQR